MARFCRKTGIAKAERITERLALESIGMDEKYWRVTYLGTGKRLLYEDTEFREAFEPLDREAKEMLKC